jgi:secernin
MCDTMLAPPSSTLRRTMLFGKNSDRQRNEAQAVEYIGPADHPPKAQVACTYITIPQVPHTYGVLICRPFWIWGAEMGSNEHGVVIGNEGIHARSPAPKENALLGMDLLRLALERANTASQAVEVIIGLLERHGQGGNCGHLEPSYYNNGFMIADATEAFVLETIGREWLLERVGGVRTISNCYSISDRADCLSRGLMQLLHTSDWSHEERPRFAEVIGDPQREHIGHAQVRRARGTSLLLPGAGQLAVEDMMRTLRDHGGLEGPDGRCDQASGLRTICMHAGGPDRLSQTVGSMVSELGPKRAVHWVTGTSAPCISIFKPVLIDAPLPSAGPAPSARFDEATLWWRHERLHRGALLRNLGGFADAIRDERDALEAHFRARLDAVLDNGTESDRARVVIDCWNEAAVVEDRWFEQIVQELSPEDGISRNTWREMSRLAGMDPSS